MRFLVNCQCKLNVKFKVKLNLSESRLISTQFNNFNLFPKSQVLEMGQLHKRKLPAIFDRLSDSKTISSPRASIGLDS